MALPVKKTWDFQNSNTFCTEELIMGIYNLLVKTVQALKRDMEMPNILHKKCPLELPQISITFYFYLYLLKGPL